VSNSRVKLEVRLTFSISESGPWQHLPYELDGGQSAFDFCNSIAAHVIKKSLFKAIIGAWASSLQSRYSTDRCLTTHSWRKPHTLL
jgi:hypothetical protein